MYPFVRGRWSFPGAVTCIVTWVTQGIPSVINNYCFFWLRCPTTNKVFSENAAVLAKRTVEWFIQWFVQHVVAHNRRVKSPWASIWLVVSPWACVWLVVLWIVGFGVIFTRWRNLLLNKKTKQYKTELKWDCQLEYLYDLESCTGRSNILFKVLLAGPTLPGRSTGTDQTKCVRVSWSSRLGVRCTCSLTTLPRKTTLKSQKW